jgi:hypothetical protein
MNLITEGISTPNKYVRSRRKQRVNQLLNKLFTFCGIWIFIKFVTKLSTDFILRTFKPIWAFIQAYEFFWIHFSKYSYLHLDFPNKILYKFIRVYHTSYMTKLFNLLWLYTLIICGTVPAIKLGSASNLLHTPLAPLAVSSNYYSQQHVSKRPLSIFLP